MKTKYIVYMGVLGAMAFILMSIFSIPILPHAQYLRFEPSEIPSLIAACFFGPLAGIFVNLIKDVLYFMFRAKSIFGPSADFLATSSFAFTVGFIYIRYKSTKGLIWAFIIGMLVRVIIMIPVNLVILYLQFGMSPSEVMGMMIPVIIPFNLIKGGINAGVSFVLIKLLLNRMSFFDFAED